MRGTSLLQRDKGLHLKHLDLPILNQREAAVDPGSPQGHLCSPPCGRWIRLLFALPENRFVDALRVEPAHFNSGSCTTPAAGSESEKEDPCLHVYALICHRGKVVEDPTGDVEPDVAGEVEALRLYEEITHKNPHWTSDQVDDELVKLIYTEKRRHRLMDVFSWVVHAMERFIDQQPASVLSPRTKAQLKYRVRSTRLELPPPTSIYAGEPDLFTKNDVYYATLNSGRRVIRVGGAYLLTVRSWFNRVFTFAHELAHSIDPCEMEGLKIPIPAYERLVQCFAKEGLMRVEKNASLCGANDQRAEVFADWVAVHITVDAIEQYRPKFKNPAEMLNSAINSVRDLCHQESWLDDDVQYHPEPRTRIEMIFGRSPRIREFLGCKPAEGAAYCAFEGE